MGILDTVAGEGVVDYGCGCRSLDAGVGTGPVEGNLAARRHMVLDYNLVAADHTELVAVAGSLPVVGDCSSPAVAAGSLVLGEEDRRKIAGLVDSRRLRRLHSTRCLTFCRCSYCVAVEEMKRCGSDGFW